MSLGEGAPDLEMNTPNTGGPSNPGNTNPFGYPPPPVTTITTCAKPTELKINPPKPFSGKRDEFDKFLQDVILYLELNDEIYDNNKKKIAYTLSFMNEGDAAAWKSQYLIEARTPSGLNLTVIRRRNVHARMPPF